MAKTPRVRDIGVDPDLLKAEARVAELEAEVERWKDIANHGASILRKAEAEVGRLRDTKDTLEAVKHSNRSLEAEVEKLQDELALSRHYRDDLSVEVEKLREKLNEQREPWVAQVLAQAEPALRALEARAEKAEADREGWRGSARGWKEVAVEARAERDRLDLEVRDLRIEVDLMTRDRDRLAEALRLLVDRPDINPYGIARAALSGDE